MNMTYDELRSKFNFELPGYAADGFEGFINSYDRSHPVLSAEGASLVADKTGLPEDGKQALIDCAAAINADANTHICASFLVHLCVFTRAPWLNYIYTDDLFDVPGLKKEQVGWVIVACQLLNTITNKKPPEDKNEENINAFRGYSQNCFNKNGYWGILEWNWNMLCAGGCMFMFGILKFVPGEFGGDFRIITNGEKYVSLVGGSYYVNQNGELVDSAEKSVCKTGFYEDGEKYVANVITARGYVRQTPTEFKKSEWRDYLKKGSPTLEIHIPSKIEYTPEKIKEAYKLALDFFKDFYPDHKTKAIAGYSEGTVLVAGMQTDGKGRLGRRFYSPADTGVYMSILLRPSDIPPSKALRLTTAAAVAVCRAIESVSGKDPKIKWVNDVYLDNRKVCGILTEGAVSLESGSLDYVVLGVGINVYRPEKGFPADIEDIAGYIFDEKTNDGKNMIAAAFLNNFMKIYQSGDFESYIDEYRKRSFIIKKNINVINDGSIRKAFALDIDDNCRLIVCFEDGTMEHLDAGEISIRL